MLLDYYRCSTCGLYFLGSDDHLPSTVRSYDDIYARAPRPDSITIRRYRSLLEELLPWRRVGRLLEVGCGSGGLLEQAVGMGWECWGTELSPVAASLARSSGATVLVGDVAALSLPRPYDVVIMLEVLEHVADPVATMKAAHSLLRSGGLLVLSTPNSDGLTRRLFGSRWSGFDAEHFACFSRRSIRALLASTGYRALTLRTVHLNPFEIGSLLKTSHLFRRSGNAFTPREDPALHPKAAGYATTGSRHQGLRRRIEASRWLRVAKGAANRALDLAGVGETLWVRAICVTPQEGVD